MTLQLNCVCPEDSKRTIRFYQEQFRPKKKYENREKYSVGFIVNQIVQTAATRLRKMY
jgi:hypothetical protein